MTINESLIQRLHRQYQAFEDCLQEVWLALLSQPKQLTETEIEAIVLKSVKKAKNTRVREGYQFTGLQEPQVHIKSGVISASKLSKLFPKADYDNEAGFMLALRSSMVNALPDKERGLLQSYYLEGKTSKELVSAYGSSASGVRHCVRRAKNKLEKLMSHNFTQCIAEAA